LQQFRFLASATNCRPMKTKISSNESWTRCAHSDVFCFRPCFAPASPQPTGPQTQYWLTSRHGEYPRPAKHFDPDARRLQREKSRVSRPRGHYFFIWAKISLYIIRLYLIILRCCWLTFFICLAPVGSMSLSSFFSCVVFYFFNFPPRVFTFLTPNEGTSMHIDSAP